MMLYKLLAGLNRDAFDAEVACLGRHEAMADRIAALGVKVKCFGIVPGRLQPGPLVRLALWLRRSRFDVVQTWMYHADLIGGLASKMAASIPVAWGIRQSNVDAEHNKRATLWIIRLCAKLSRSIPARIVCCSEAARSVHENVGYCREKLLVIPNGFDLDTFRPDAEARHALREELGLAESDVLIGLVARFDSQKDHRTFVRAAGLLREPARRNVHFLMCGEGVDGGNRALARWIAEAGISERCHLLGLREDVPRIDAALDVAVSSSVGEGFSNAVGEAMACGVPCVATDTGDARTLVGDTGRVVSAAEPAVLAHALDELVDLGAEKRRHLGENARRRIAERFSLSAVAARYEALYRELASHVRD
jgi:glycosyltransferase involved in cell wall biosynthesis